MLVQINESTLKIAREIFDIIIDNSENASEYDSCCFARDIFEYTLANNTKKLEKIERLFKEL